MQPLMTLSLLMTDIMKMMSVPILSHENRITWWYAWIACTKIDSWRCLRKSTSSSTFSQRFEHAGVICLVKQCVLSRQQSALSSLQCPVLTVYNGCELCAAISINACTTANTHEACSDLFWECTVVVSNACMLCSNVDGLEVDSGQCMTTANTHEPCSDLFWECTVVVSNACMLYSNVNGLEVDSGECMTTANTTWGLQWHWDMTTANAHVPSTYVGKDRPEYMLWLRELSVILHLMIHLDYKVECTACICN